MSTGKRSERRCVRTADQGGKSCLHTISCCGAPDIELNKVKVLPLKVTVLAQRAHGVGLGQLDGKEKKQRTRPTAQ